MQTIFSSQNCIVGFDCIYTDAILQVIEARVFLPTNTSYMHQTLQCPEKLQSGRDYCGPPIYSTLRPNSLTPHCITYLQHFFAPDGRSATTTYYLSTYLLYCIASCVFALLAPGLLSLIDWREDGSGISRHLEKPEMSLDTTEKSTLCKGAEKVSLFHPNGREQ